MASGNVKLLLSHEVTVSTRGVTDDEQAEDCAAEGAVWDTILL